MKKIILSSVIAISIISALNSCKSQAEKDAELKTKIETAAPGIVVNVNDGVVTLNGQVNDENAKLSTEESIKKISGVKSVINNIEVPEPIIINPDQAIIDAMNTILTNYNGVTGVVSEGEITLTGEINRSDLQTLMQALNSINPKKINNQLVIK
jgi:hyperosmotically inducible protein